MSILYPVVPIAPGVPSVFRDVASFASGLAAQTAPPILTSDGVISDYSSPQWGIFDANLNPVITGDSTLRIGYVHEYQVSDYPTEDGGFQSYNRVQKPYEVKIAFAQGGGVEDVSAFLLGVEATLASLDLYTVVTPEAAYPNLSLNHMDYDRSASSGAQLLDVEVWSREVRVAAAPAFTTTANPQAKSVQVGGQVQGQTPTQAQAAAAADGAG
jgi:hypothetical protein